MKRRLFRLSYTNTFGVGSTIYSELRRFETLLEAIAFAQRHIKEATWTNLSVYKVEEVLA